MVTKKIKMSAIAGGIDALERLMTKRLVTWSKIREVSKLYGEIVDEVQAYNAELGRLAEQYPERRGEEYERRLAMLISGETTVSAVKLTADDFISPEDYPSPSDMFALGKIIELE